MVAFYFRARNDFGRIRAGDVVLVDPSWSPRSGFSVLAWPSWLIAAAEDVQPDSVIGTIVNVYIKGRAPAALAGFFNHDHILTTYAKVRLESYRYIRKNKKA